MVLAMSELYRVSLDEAFEGGIRKMIEPPGTKHRHRWPAATRLARRITVLAYLVVWALVILTLLAGAAGRTPWATRWSTCTWCCR